MKNLVSNEYLELVRRFPLRPLRSKRDLDKAIAVIDGLIDREKRSRDEEDYLDVLGDLVHKYENEHHPIEDPSAQEMLKFQIDNHSTNQRAVALGAGIAVSTISEVLAGRRNLNLDHIQKLAAFFGVEPALFIPRKKKVPEKADSVRRRFTERRESR